ncbi:hypothetical protein SCARD494_05842 [Seiridium cardinale]
MVNRDKKEGDEQDARHDPECDFRSIVERIVDTAERQGHGVTGNASFENSEANPVLDAEFLTQRDVYRINAGQTEKELWREDASDNQVKVERLTPGGAALGERTTDDGANNATDTVHGDDTGEV